MSPLILQDVLSIAIEHMKSHMGGKFPANSDEDVLQLLQVARKEYIEHYHLTIDDDGYVTYYDPFPMGPGLIWFVHSGGWECYINLKSEEYPIYDTGQIVFPTEDEFGEAAELYEKWYEETKNG